MSSQSVHWRTSLFVDHWTNQFMGEISLCMAVPPPAAAHGSRYASDRVPREAFLTLMSQIPEMSDIINHLFAARRRRQLDEAPQRPVSDRRGGRSERASYR